MLRNFLLVAWRNLLRHRMYTFINLLGLSLGLSACILLLLYVRFEFSFDQDLPGAADVYRVDTGWHRLENPADSTRYAQGYVVPLQVNRMSQVSTPLYEALMQEVSGVRAATTMWTQRVTCYIHGDPVNESAEAVDSLFLEVLPFRVAAGNVRHPLRQVNDLVLSRRKAEAWFGSAEQAIGQVIPIRIGQEKQPFVVSAVVDVPANSSIQFDLLFRKENRMDFAQERNAWHSLQSRILIRTQPGAKPETINRALAWYYHRNVDLQFGGKPLDAGALPMTRFVLAPLLDMHLYDDASFGIRGDLQSLQILTVLALMILTLATVNYIVLALSRALARSREVSVRVAIGAKRSQLLGQFLTEAALVLSGAMLLALLWTLLLLPVASEITQRQLAFPWADAEFWLLLLSLFQGVSLFSGLVPAWWMSRVRTGLVLKSRASYRISPWSVRALVLFQFTISLALLGGTLVLQRQLQYLLNRPLGYEPDRVVMLQLPASIVADSLQADMTLNRMRTALNGNAAIQQVAPLNMAYLLGTVSTRIANAKGEEANFYLHHSDQHYLPTLGIQLLAGQNLSPNPVQRKSQVLLNRAALAHLGFANPDAAIGQTFPFGPNATAKTVTIAGVMQDVNYQSLRDEIEPLAVMSPDYGGAVAQLAVRIAPGQYAEALPILETAWKRALPDQPFVHFWLKDMLRQNYTDVERWQRIASFGTAVALIIAVLGVVGLAGITAANRKREVGIRKVLGASVRQILLLLNRDILLLLVGAGLLAAPMVWYYGRDWLQNFHYRIALTPDIYVLATLILGLVALAAASWQTWRAARHNPTDSLRSE